MRITPILALVVVTAACPPPATPPPPKVDPGALIALSMDGSVGVLLDEIPAALRDRAADDAVNADASFWTERVRQQLRMTGLRLVFRSVYYTDPKASLPLPPEEQWDITVDAPARATVDGHDVVSATYHFSSTLLSDFASVPVSEPALADTGGVWDESFVFPIDPTLILQRTGFACMDEDQYPPDSVDAENAFLFFDDTCEIETPDQPACHYTAEPTETCVDAITRVIGKAPATLHFERLAWDDAKASAVRFGEVTHTDGPDMKVLVSGLEINRTLYRYFAPDDCAIADGCIGAPGWRRIVTFDSHDQNVGGKALAIGAIDYFIDGHETDLSGHGMYEYSACHNHYHFKYYGDFSFGDGAGEAIQKNGFCLESTDRLSNNETSPLNTAYSDCTFQGVEAGWGDLYQAGLTCNWVDVTGVDTTAGDVTGPLTFHSNPDDFLCEGQLVTDADGNQVWEPTDFTTADGQPVDRPKCTFFSDAADNDTGTTQVTLPQVGGMVTTACSGVSSGVSGPLKNCGFTPGDSLTCTPGASLSLSCAVADTSKPQVLRACEKSAVLGDIGTACVFQDALANTVVDGAAVAVTVTCPGSRDANEPGGKFELYTSPVLDEDGDQAVTCTVQ